MRLYGLTQDEVTEVISAGERDGEDRHGNLFYAKRVRGRTLRVVLALDDLGTVITVYDLEE